MNTNTQLQQMSDQELRRYFAQTRERKAYQEILKRGPNQADREALRKFQEWGKSQVTP